MWSHQLSRWRDALARVLSTRVYFGNFSEQYGSCLRSSHDYLDFALFSLTLAARGLASVCLPGGFLLVVFCAFAFPALTSARSRECGHIPLFKRQVLMAALFDEKRTLFLPDFFVAHSNTHTHTHTRGTHTPRTHTHTHARTRRQYARCTHAHAQTDARTHAYIHTRTHLCTPART